MREFLREQIKKLEVYEKIADRAEKAYTADYTNEEKEKAFDKAYELEYNQYIATAEAFVKFTNNKIDFDTAKKMIKTKRTELIALLA